MLTALMESLILKTTAWENERGKPFLYDGVGELFYILAQQSPTFHEIML